jgi:hypothetical protein
MSLITVLTLQLAKDLVSEDMFKFLESAAAAGRSLDFKFIKINQSFTFYFFIKFNKTIEL